MKRCPAGKVRLNGKCIKKSDYKNEQAQLMRKAGFSRGYIKRYLSEEERF